VIELGANHQGEIAWTVSLTRPEAALVNRSRVIGTPISLFRLPAVYSVLPHWLRIAAVISLTVRQQVPTRVVALTGSSGKTSVKEMTAAILSQCGASG
jgi:UDP-N-acetylmuramyl pentapeptide synthase